MIRKLFRSKDDGGFSVLEVTIASFILLAVLSVFAGALVSLQETEQFTRKRNEALDDLRLMANTFAKEARHASSVQANGPTSFSMTTYSGAASFDTPKLVTYSAEPDGPSGFRLQRQEGSDVRIFNIRLTGNQVFCYTIDCTTVPRADVRSVRISVFTQLDARRSPVGLSTEVNLRNVR